MFTSIPLAFHTVLCLLAMASDREQCAFVTWALSVWWTDCLLPLSLLRIFLSSAAASFFFSFFLFLFCLLEPYRLVHAEYASLLTETKCVPQNACYSECGPGTSSTEITREFVVWTVRPPISGDLYKARVALCTVSREDEVSPTRGQWDTCTTRHCICFPRTIKSSFRYYQQLPKG